MGFLQFGAKVNQFLMKISISIKNTKPSNNPNNK